MEWEHRNWYSFLWLCGDQIVEQHFHNIDFMNWVMGTHPVSVVATGGAAWRPREALYGNIYDHMSSDFVYANGVHLSQPLPPVSAAALYSNVERSDRRLQGPQRPAWTGRARASTPTCRNTSTW